ncbi:MAG TPA: TetR/AcrR family transcriptional regulator [Streptosporangiaceae bacterium]
MSETETETFSSPRVVRKHRMRRAGILKAAASVFAEMGYHRASLEEIADRIDLTRASLYHYFPSKDALLSACLEYGAEEANNRLAEVVKSTVDQTATERLRSLIITQLTVITVDAPELSRLFLSPMDWPDMFRAQVRNLRDRHDSFFRLVIEEGVHSGEFTCIDSNVARHCLHGGMNYVPVWLRHGKPGHESSIRTVADTLLEMFVNPSAAR